MPARFLLTGVTGGLGAKILHDMLEVHNVDARSIIATSRSISKRGDFEKLGVQFRVADYNDRSTLETAFEGVENLLFMSSSTRDNPTRNREHGNVVSAAKKAGVGKVWYVSLAFGGFSDSSKIGFQQAHYETENLLQVGGLDFVSLRAGVYTDAFPLFLNWYASSEAVLLPRVTPPVEQGGIAFTSRHELGEAMATLLAKGFEGFPSIKPQTGKNIVLLTSQKLETLPEMVQAINSARETSMPVEVMEPQKWIDACALSDEGGKPKAWFEARLVFTQGVCGGDAAVIDPALATLLGRTPETGTQGVRRLLKANPNYTWHQNHMR